jgi:hypothetical protein
MDRLTIGVAAGVLALVAVGLVTAAVMRSQSAEPDPSTPRGVVLAYALAEDRGDGAAAWELLASSTQQRSDRDRYLARVGQTVPTEARVYLTTEGEQISGDGASVVLVRTYAGSGSLFGGGSSSSRTTVRLTQDPAGWRITVPPDEYNLVEPAARNGA